jgi:hypothetical protein
MYTLLDTDKDCDVLPNRPVLSAGRTLHDKQSCSCLDCNQNLVTNTEGAQRQDGLSDWPPVAKWLTLWLSVVCQTTLRYVDVVSRNNFHKKFKLPTSCSVKVNLSLCFNWTPLHEGVLGSGGIAPRVLHLGTRWGWVVSFTSRLLTTRKSAAGTHWIGGWVGPRADLYTVVKRKISSPWRESDPQSSSP